MISGDDVVRFLAEHPDFFDRYPQLLEQLRVPHGSNGTISLVERQVKALRERQAVSRERLAELVRVARSNDLIAERVHKLTLRLLHTRSIEEIYAQVDVSIREDFEVKPCKILLSGSALGVVESLLSAGRPLCGHFPEAQRTALFGDAGSHVASMALVPIGAGASRGALLLGSADPNRFNPGVNTDFLARIGEMISAALARHGVEPRV